MLAFRIFDDSGFAKKLRAVPEDNEGIDIEFLKKEIKKSEDKAQQEGNNEPVGGPLFASLHYASSRIFYFVLESVNGQLPSM
jgi:hypothetical protein